MINARAETLQENPLFVIYYAKHRVLSWQTVFTKAKKEFDKSQRTAVFSSN
jgi:putative SOS response-associated peptidase YedK